MTTRISFTSFSAVALLVALVAWVGFSPSTASFVGVDEAVIERFAHLAGREPKNLLFNLDRGDLLLFLFLLAGTVGGFIAGYFFRELFPSQRGKSSDEAPR
jgi:cobalt/nickel transport system permease protein